jgi:hypothetical protein
MDIKQKKEEFMAAYEWMLKVHRALLFTDISGEVTHRFTPANMRPDTIDAFTVEITIHPKTGKMLEATWAPWYGEVTFGKEKARIEGFLLAKGIEITQ